MYWMGDTFAGWQVGTMKCMSNRFEIFFFFFFFGKIVITEINFN